MVTGETERTGPLNAGETYQHPGVARLIIGRLQPSVATATMPTWNALIPSIKRRGGRLERLRRIVGDRGWSA